MAKIQPLITRKEIEERNAIYDYWVVVEGKVYDLTSYLDEHPGGANVVLAAAGKDATDDFEDAGHGKSARESWRRVCIGELDTSSDEQVKDYPQKLLVSTKR